MYLYDRHLNGHELIGNHRQTKHGGGVVFYLMEDISYWIRSA